MTTICEISSMSQRRMPCLQGGVFPVLCTWLFRPDSFGPGYFGPIPSALVISARFLWPWFSFSAGPSGLGTTFLRRGLWRDRQLRPPARQSVARRLPPARVAQSAKSAGRRWRSRRVAADVDDTAPGRPGVLARQPAARTLMRCRGEYPRPSSPTCTGSPAGTSWTT